MVLQRILLSTTRSLMLNSGRQWRDPDSSLQTCRDLMSIDCCEIDENQHVKVTFLLGESGRGKRVCAREGETIAQIAERNKISLMDAARIEAFLQSDVRPQFVDDTFYTNMRGPGHLCPHENFLHIVLELSCPNELRQRALTKERHDGLHVALL